VLFSVMLLHNVGHGGKALRIAHRGAAEFMYDH
jgi:hypothetical protein